MCGASFFLHHFQKNKRPAGHAAASTWTNDPRIVDFGLALKIGWPVGPDLMGQPAGRDEQSRDTDFQGLEAFMAAEMEISYDIFKRCTLYILFPVPLEPSILN